MPLFAPQAKPWPPTDKGKADAQLVADAANGRFVTTVIHPDGQELGYLVTLPTGGKSDSEGTVVPD